MNRARIVGVGSYAPQRILTNHELAKMVDTSDEWIVQRTGIRERRIVAEGEGPSDLAVRAARQPEHRQRAAGLTRQHHCAGLPGQSGHCCRAHQPAGAHWVCDRHRQN